MTKNTPQDQHLAAGCFVLNKKKDKVLLLYHKKLQKWLIPGGHVEIHESPHQAALRETKEETNISPTLLRSEEQLSLESDSGEEVLPLPITILRERIPENKKDSEHYHVDFIYLAEAESTDIIPETKEVDDVQWFSKSEVAGLDTFNSIKQLCERLMV